MSAFEFIQALLCIAVTPLVADRMQGLSLKHFHARSINRKGPQTLLDPPDDPSDLQTLALKTCSQVGLRGQFVTQKEDLLGTHFHCKRTIHKLGRDHLSRQDVWAMPRHRHSKHVFCKASVNFQRPIGVRRGPCLVGKSPVTPCHLMQSRDILSWISRRQSQQVNRVNTMIRSRFMGVLAEAKQKTLGIAIDFQIVARQIYQKSPANDCKAFMQKHRNNIDSKYKLNLLNRYLFKNQKELNRD
jgi:hypothetical protein